jgi:hypothetical protein
LNDTIVQELESKIAILISKGEYQQALDNSLFLLSEKNKEHAFKIIKDILRRAPSTTTLYIKDKKVSYSERKVWIRKMEENLEAGKRDSQASFYDEASISDEWTLVESSKKYSDKKALRKMDKELSGNKELAKI